MVIGRLCGKDFFFCVCGGGAIITLGWPLNTLSNPPKTLGTDWTPPPFGKARILKASDHTSPPSQDVFTKLRSTPRCAFNSKALIFSFVVLI